MWWRLVVARRRILGTTATVLVAHLGSELYGSDRVLLESVIGLVRGGNRVVVALPSPGPLGDAVTASGAGVAICSTPVVRRSTLRPLGILRFLSDTVRGVVKGTLLIRRIRPDVLYVNTVTIPLWIFLARLHGIPVLVHVHEAEDSLPRFALRILNFPLLFATRVVTNSHHSVGVLASAYHRLSRSAVIYNGIPGPDRVIAARPTLSAGVRILYIGRLSPRKGVDCVLNAVAELNRQGVESTLVLVGAVFPGYEWYEQQLREQVVALKLEEQVTFEGFRSSIWTDVAFADAVIVPSRSESFGNIAIEAILGGRPVITSNAPGLAEATAGYDSAQSFPIDDEITLAKSIISLVNDWPRIRAASETDIARARDRHSPAGYHRAVFELVTSVAAR